MKNILIILILLIFFICFLLNPNILINSTISSMNIFIYSIFPTLFPMFIITDLLINYNFHYYINKIFGKIFNKIFKINNICSFVFIMSLISGYSTSYSIINELYNKGLIDNKCINKIVLFTHFINPLYFITIGTSLLNKKIAITLFIISIISNIIVGLIFRNYNISSFNITYKNDSISFFNCLTNSIKKSINTSFTILGTLITTSIIINFMPNIILIKGLLDFTTGLNIIKGLNPKIIITLFIIFTSFGGISTHLQLTSILKIDYKKYLLSRVLNIIISLFIMILLY